MIDTVVLRIHNLKEYTKTYSMFYGATKKSVTTAYVDTSTGEVVETELQLATLFADSGRVLPLIQRSTFNISSSHYSVSYSINMVRDYIEFNFSVPKYLYTTNLFQFINTVDERASYTWQMINRFILHFVRLNIPDSILLSDLEINRIDLCYNQYFNCKEDALEYLEFQKDIMLRYARSDTNTFRPASYRTSWQYVTDRYSFKCYHKGTEFHKNDLKELMKKGGNPRGYDLPYLCRESDRILRYEMTIRNSYMNYLWRQIYVTADESSDYYNYATPDHRKLFKSFLGASANFKGKTLFEKFCGKNKKFTMESAFEYRLLPEEYLQNDAVTFDERFFYCLVDQFWQRVNRYQLEKLVSPEAVSRRIDEYNMLGKAKNSIRKNIVKLKDKPRLMTLVMLSQYLSIDSLKKFVDRTTLYRMKQDLKNMGVGDNAVPLTIPIPRLDYWEYRLSLGRYHANNVF